MKRLICIAIAAAVALPPAAFAKKGPRGPAYEDLPNNVHVRYPGDVAYPFGTVHVRGGKKIPYVEKCHWTYRIGLFGLPRGLKQTCVRYTPENTPPR